jgi:multimeric flavodoxin WrbA
VKIVGVSCSPHREGDTARALRACLAAAGEVAPGVETELVALAGGD